MARRVRRLFRGGRVVDLCAAHGLLGQLLLILDDSSPGALVVDTALAPSAAKIHRALVAAWPRLADRVIFARPESTISTSRATTSSSRAMPAVR